MQVALGLKQCLPLSAASLSSCNAADTSRLTLPAARLLSSSTCVSRASSRLIPGYLQDQSERRLTARASKQTFTTFEEMIGDSDTVLVDFYALWCGPCQLMNGVLADVAKRAGDKFRIVKIDTEKYPGLASQYKVEALPTFIVFHKGKTVDRLEGAIAADKLLARIDAAVAAASAA